ncbi:hypothetical protein B0T21DRAFT_357319 [Apiosordaria backusii]|uniref:Uncharacterized protein n=1 Tax=Apiosordaria backusii TaxID=314023 RepID=A0AA40F042_9PEZI|nr:hypothetical protein B0T21DRAFT_357319 [Apiosordaria backusii]
MGCGHSPTRTQPSHDRTSTECFSRLRGPHRHLSGEQAVSGCGLGWINGHRLSHHFWYPDIRPAPLLSASRMRCPSSTVVSSQV